MRGTQVLAVGAGFLAISVEALSLHKRSDGPSRVLGLEIERRTVADPIARDRLRRRAGTVQASSDNEVSCN
jgi:hypothetical protein